MMRVLSTLSLCLLTTLNAKAEAGRPLVRPPVMIKPGKGQLPLPMTDVITKKAVGLDIEPASVVSQALKQARDYIAYRSGGWTKSQMTKWAETCESTMVASANPYCRIEQERALSSGGSSSIASRLRSQKRALADSLKEGDFSKAEAKSYGEVVAALGSTGDLETTILPLIRKAAASKSCIPASLASAMGYKAEELFPDKDIVDLSKTLYRKSLACGKSDLSTATAAFRLGLILIWQKQYAEIDSLMKKVEAVPEASAITARATFWRYQAAVALGDKKLSEDIREQLLTKHPMTFQNLAANGEDETRMNRVISNDTPSVFTRSLVRPDLNGLFRAAEALERAGSPQLAAEILDRNVNDIGTIEPEVRLYSAAFLHRIGYSLTKFKILSSLFQDQPRLVTLSTMQLMFPLSYIDVVQKKQNELDPLMFLSLMRQESAFNPGARSGVGARGLMQVMPATARGIRRISKSQLLDPEINIEVGTKYFLSKLAQYSGDIECTLAAYNAGFARVDQWKKRYPTDNKLLFLDFIPFRETRDYVSSILRNYYWYVRLYAPDAAKPSLEANKGEPGKPSVGPGVKVQAILAANAGDAARLIRMPSSVAPPAN